jgi:hypothetical protein
VRQSNTATGRHHKENKACNLQPQLVRHAAKGASAGGRGLSSGPQGPAAPGLLPGYARDNP